VVHYSIALFSINLFLLLGSIWYADVFTQKLNSRMFGIRTMKFDAYESMNMLHLSMPFISILFFVVLFVPHFGTKTDILNQNIYYGCTKLPSPSVTHPAMKFAGHQCPCSMFLHFYRFLVF
jgi:hypothetical protein